MRETFDAPPGGGLTSGPRSYPLHLHFGELVILDASIHNYEEVIDVAVPVRPMERAAIVVKELLLRIGSAFVELFPNKNEIDMTTPLFFTEDELWVMRQAVNVSATYRGIYLGLELKRKIYEGLVAINSSDGDNFPAAIPESSKADVIQRMMDWKKAVDG